ncbi:MAG: uroporphyrinogen decarboxylase family protein [Chloroflexi bacterium]|nr:uroporphyrinogen decarboxylase family protein [Chloroflexota bacterium]MDA8189132.1 uroporphyrinogen decarboxylase family protein [Dehalococcoidales bacterium]
MKTDEMTSRERVLTAVRNGKPDRVPVVPVYIAGAVRRAGFKYSECLFDADKYVAAVAKCYADFGFDGIFDCGLPAFIAEAAGAALRVLEDDLPVPGEPVLRTYDDIDRLVPRSVLSNGRVPHVLSVISKMRKALGPTVAIVAVGAIPYRVADCFRGTQAFYKDLIRNPEFVRKILDFAVQPCIEYAEAAIEAGADMLFVPDALSSRMSMSRRHYVELNYPYTRKVFDALNQRGIAFWFHPCGDCSDRLDLATDGPTGLLLPAEADIATVKAEYGRKVSLGGNVRSVDTMLLGAPEDVRRESRGCLEHGAQDGGFILSADCTVPVATPEDNLHALVAAAREFGDYRSHSEAG